jgi:hypothetical protein
MTTFVADKSIASAPRFLTLRHARDVNPILLKDRPAPDPKDPRTAVLSDGTQQLFSYFYPGLEAGSHKVTVTHSVNTTGNAPKQTLNPQRQTRKEFIVEAAQFSLPAGCVHSTFPAEGEKAPVETLPSIIFTDPHLPWEREAFGFDVDGQKLDEKREKIPWVAVFPFGPAELQLAPEDLAEDAEFFQGTQIAKNAKDAGKRLQQSGTLTMKMPYNDFLQIKSNCKGSLASTIQAPSGQDKNPAVEIAFIKPALFNKFITTFDREGKVKNDQTKADIGHYRYLAHVRQAKTAGMAASAAYRAGLFSVAVSHRSGPLSESSEAPVITQLISIEGWHKIDFVDPINVKYVAVASLYSWTYTAVPTGALTMFDRFENLQKSIALLRAPSTLLDSLKASTAPAAPLLAKRLHDGYTMARYRTQTGGNTTSFLRGCLVPIISVPTLNGKFTSMSNCGTDMQFLDRETGMLDITYSVAWSLGKALALADQSFTKSVAALRTQIKTWAFNEAKAAKAKEEQATMTLVDALKRMGPALTTLNNLGQPSREQAPGNRWRGGSREPALDLTFANEEIRSTAAGFAVDRAKSLAAAVKDPSRDPESMERLYNELNSPSSSDWMVMLSWILDRLYLFGIPIQYLLVDSSFLPNESIRFFKIDPNWMDALIDGALSVANHISRSDDFIRRAIKTALNEYLKRPDKDINYRPQIPSFGCLIRSDLITQFPDMRVQSPLTKGTEQNRAPILRQEIIGEGLLLCLFDRSPADIELNELSFAQPPHQQTFIIGEKITTHELEMEYRRTYSKLKDEDKYDYGGLGLFDGSKHFLRGENNDARLLLLNSWVKDLETALGKMSKDDYDETKSTSALVGFQLSSPVCRIKIIQNTDLQKLVGEKLPFQLNLLDRSIAEQPKAEDVAFAFTSKLAVTSTPKLLATPLLQATPPNYRPIPKLSSSLDMVVSPSLVYESGIIIPSGPGRAEPATRPSFTYAAYPIQGDRTNVPSGTKRPIDLVFSVIRDQDQLLDDFFLKEIKVRLRTGPQTPRLKERQPLFQTYNGPGPSMLSNLRFNALAENAADVLQLRLVPRSHTGTVPLAHVKDCSFLLSMVTLYPIDGKVEIHCTETYDNHRGSFQSVFHVELEVRGS